MLNIAGYQTLEKIYSSVNSLVYRGIRIKDRQPVILKILKEDYPTPEELRRYKQEYEIIRSLNLAGVVKAYSLESYQRTLVIILEDFGGICLKKKLSPLSDIESKPLSIVEFLPIAIQTTETLAHLHAANIIHKDINPSNIIYNPELKQVKIIDFGISTRFAQENTTPIHPNIIEGTLAYISPEQTGRMNRFLDYRTDFYSLGCTFYELLTGELPFDSTDPLELVHAHIAKQPVIPHKLCPAIPPVISKIILKLMAKTAEERYQSAWVIKADLEKCLDQLQTTGKVKSFPLETLEIYDRFQIPQKLYGREAEVQILLNTFQKVTSGGNQMLLVAGYSGIGKSALVREIYKHITDKKGYFISGKYDLYQRNIPYIGIIQAFTVLIQQLLSESETKLDRWRKKLLKALGNNGQVMIQVIPELESIIGPQPPVPELGSEEAKNRFNFVFKRFLTVLSQPSHPLVIFLDDMQWADQASLELMKLLLLGSDAGLFVIAAYRDNEVSATHPLSSTIKYLEDRGEIIHRIFLKPLDLPTVNQLISDSLNLPKAKTRPLAELCYKKTRGNPFFLQNFLKSLYTEKLLCFNSSILEWQWDLDRISEQAMTDNVVELMAKTIQKLPEPSQNILKLAACMGDRFELTTLATVTKQSLKETVLYLNDAIAEYLVIPISNTYKYIELDIPLSREASVEYKFVHDRIHQAAYSLIPEAEKPIIHRQLGQWFLDNTPVEQRLEKIFDIVNQLNQGTTLIHSASEREKLAQLNLIAGQKAKASAAYQPALNYLNIGIELLSRDRWETQYHLTKELYVEASEAAYLSGNLDEMQKFVQAVRQNAKLALDKVKVYQVQIQAYAAQNKFLEAVGIAEEILNLFGVKLPAKPSQSDILRGLVKTKLALMGKNPAHLINLPKMTDPVKLAAMRILTSTASSAYLAVPNLYPLIIFQQVNLSLKYGNTADSAYGYSCYGLILCGVLGDFDLGYQFGELALNLFNRLNSQEFKANLWLTFNFFIRHWHEPIRDTLHSLLEGYESGLETGSLQYAAYCACVYCLHSSFSGRELAALETEIAEYCQALSQIKQETSRKYNDLYLQFVLNLRSPQENPTCLVGEVYDEEKTLQFYRQINDRYGMFGLFLHKLIICYLFEENELAVDHAWQGYKYIDSVTGSIFVSVFNFYQSLAFLAICDRNQPQKTKLLKQVKANQKKMKKWAKYAPMNYLHKFYLVAAELQRIQGNNSQAMDLYDRAIASAQTAQYINEEALANELAAKFYFNRGKYLIARAYMQEARYCYLKWGATAKVKHLEATYPQLLIAKLGKFSDLQQVTSTTNLGLGETLDLATVMKASQAISSELRLNKLLERLMKIIIENAGAQVGYLILENQGKLKIEAEGAIDLEQVTVLQSIPVQDCLTVSPAIIKYVERTKHTVVLNDATSEGNFTNEPYIKKHQPKSILCYPLINQGKFNGIVYLENNLTTGAFTPQRLEMLNMLSGQVAIAIENARFYHQMAELNQAYERFVPNQFLELLEKESIVEVELGDNVQREMSVLFTDIRSFTTLSETMTPEQNFKFINSYLKRMEPAILENNGFIDKYIGDGIMALFARQADDAVKAGISILQRLDIYNQYRVKSGYIPIQIGIGINTGELMLGTVGGYHRMDSTVISDAVNLAARVESLTKNYGISLLITQQTFVRLSNPSDYGIRLIGQGGEMVISATHNAMMMV